MCLFWNNCQINVIKGPSAVHQDSSRSFFFQEGTNAELSSKVFSLLMTSNRDIITQTGSSPHTINYATKPGLLIPTQNTGFSSRWVAVSVWMCLCECIIAYITSVIVKLFGLRCVSRFSSCDRLFNVKDSLFAGNFTLQFSYLSCKLIIVFDWFNIKIFYQISFCNIDTIYRLFVT